MVTMRRRRDPSTEGPRPNYTWSKILSPVALDAALQLAQGPYQRAVIMGTESASGSTLKDRHIGATFRKNYWRSLNVFFGRLTAAGVAWRLVPCDVPVGLRELRKRWRAHFDEVCLTLGTGPVPPVMQLLAEGMDARMAGRPDLAAEPLSVAADGLESMGLDAAADEVRHWAYACATYPLRREVCPVAHHAARRSSYRFIDGRYERWTGAGWEEI